MLITFNIIIGKMLINVGQYCDKSIEVNLIEHTHLWIDLSDLLEIFVTINLEINYIFQI